jgi:hypothetical protein
MRLIGRANARRERLKYRELRGRVKMFNTPSCSLLLQSKFYSTLSKSSFGSDKEPVNQSPA